MLTIFSYLLPREFLSIDLFKSPGITMESSEIVRNQILDIIKNQIATNTPPETKQTLKRLLAMGYSDWDARMLIGQCVAVEIYNILKHKMPFDNQRYVSNLKNLPEEPFDDKDEE